MTQPIRLKNDPIGWDETNKIIERDAKWHGLFFKYSPQLQFIKDGKAFIQQVYEQYGIEGEIQIFIYKRDNGSRKFELNYTGRLNLTRLEISKLYATCDIEQTGFIQKLKNRQNLKVNLQSLFTQDGNAIQAFANETHSVSMHSKKLVKTTRMKFVNGVAFTGEDCDAINYLQLFGDTIEDNEIGDYLNLTNGVSSSIPVNAFKLKENSIISFTVRYELTKLRRTIAEDCVGSSYSYLSCASNFDFFIKKNNETPIAFTKTNYTSGGVSSTVFSYTNTLSFEIGDTITIYCDVVTSLDDGGTIGVVDPTSESLIVYGETLSTPAYLPVKVGCGTIGWSLNNIDLAAPSLVSTPSYIQMVAETTYIPTNVPFVLMHEAFDRVINSITNKADSFRSSLYGRTDSEPVTYASDGSGCLKAISRALTVRGFPIADYPIYASFIDLLKTAQSIDGIGLGVEKQGDVERVVIEPLSYFYVAESGWKINNVTDLRKLVLEDYFFNELETGYEKWSNEEVNNLDEFNTKREYALPITQVKNKLSLLCPYIASGYTIEFLRRDGYTSSSTKDNERDNENVILQVRRDGESFVAAKDEEFTSVDNLISPETSYNLEISPMRNLIRNGRLIRGGLIKQADKSINLTFGEGNNEVITEKPGAGPINEKSIAISELGNPFWTGEAYTFKAKVTAAVFSQIEANLYKYGEFSETTKNHKKGYLIKAEPDKDGYTKFTLLRAYT